ncbi:unnamed protein product, partial [Hapterophycus canaliculatus]
MPPAYAALCRQRDGLVSRFGFGPDPHYPEGTGDVEEDLGEDADVTRSMSLPTLTLRPPPASERASVVNPIFAGRGSRMKRNGVNGDGCGGGDGNGGNGGGVSERRTSLASIETEMSSGEDIENGWQMDGENSSGGGGGGGKHDMAGLVVKFCHRTRLPGQITAGAERRRGCDRVETRRR